MTIYKYPLLRTEIQTVSLPEGHTILHVGLDPKEELCLWAEVPDEAQKEDIQIFIVPTGYVIPDDAIGYLGTVKDGNCIWHIYIE